MIYYVKPESRKLVGLVGGHCVGGEKSKEGKDKDKDRDALSVRER